MTNASASPTTTNGMTYADLTAAATLLGAQAGMGKDTQIKMLMKVVEGAYHGIVDMDKNKHGADCDDAFKLAEAYVKAQTGATVFDAKAPNQRKTISCFRTCVKLGSWPKGGTGEPLSTVNELMTIRAKLRQTPATAKKLDDAANTLLKFARAQLKKDTLISHGELRDFCFRKDPDLKTAEDVIEAQRNALQKLYNGKVAHGTVQDNSPAIKQAIEKLTSRLKEIAQAKGAAPQP